MGKGAGGRGRRRGSLWRTRQRRRRCDDTPMSASGFLISQPGNGCALPSAARMRRVFSQRLRGAGKKPPGFEKTIPGSEKTLLGFGNTAWGFGNTAWGFGNTAWGFRATARGFGNTAWGFRAPTRGSGKTAWGFSATARGSGRTAWGFGATARGFGKTARGSGATARGFGNTARGFGENRRPFQRILRAPLNSVRDGRGGGRWGMGDSPRDGTFSSRPSAGQAGPFLSGLGWSLCGCLFFGETPLCGPGTRNPMTNKQPRRHAHGTV